MPDPFSDSHELDVMKSRTESTRSRRDDDDDDAGVEGFFRDGSDNEHRGLLQTQTPSALHPSENDEDEEDNEDRDDNGSEKDAIPARMSSATRSTLTTPGGNHDRQSRHDRQKRKQFIRETFREVSAVRPRQSQHPAQAHKRPLNRLYRPCPSSFSS